MSIFLQSATGHPERTQRRIARQSSRGVPPADAAYKDFRQNGGPILVNQTQIPRMTISTGGAPQQKLTGKRTIGGGPLLIGDVDPSNLGFLMALANVFGYYDYTDATTYQKWMFHLGGATAADGYLSVLNDNDINPRTRFIDGLLGGFQIGATPNGNFAAQFPFIFGNYDFYAAPTQTVGSGSTAWHLKHTWSGNWEADATDKDIYIQRVSKSGSTWTLSAKVGSAASYSATFDVIEGLDSAGNPRYTNVVDDAGALIGTWAEPVQIHIPASATGSDLDEWKFAKRRDRWTQSLETERPISSVESVIYWDPDAGGAPEEIRVEGGFQSAGQWSRLEALQTVARRQGASVDRGGDLNITITPTRRITDLRLQKAIHEGETGALIIDSKTSVDISGAGRPYRFLQIFPNVRLFGDMYDVQAGANNKDEAPVGEAGLPSSAYSYDGYTVPVTSHYAAIIENDITTSEW